MTKEEANRHQAYQALSYFDGFDAGLEYANRWTYCEDALPTERGLYLVSLSTGSVLIDMFTGTDWYAHLSDHVIAWRPLPKAAEIKRSEDDV